MAITYHQMPGGLFVQDLLVECAELYSNHYGVWGALASLHGQRIKRSSSKIEELLKAPDSFICYARDGSRVIPYIEEDVEYTATENTASINTNFFVDHSNVPAMIQDVTSKENPWRLGEIAEGHEWFAFTFKQQRQITLTQQEIKDMLQASDDIVKDALSRMDISFDHKWATHSTEETSFVIEECGLQLGDEVYDFGCGLGRHSLELAKKGMQVRAVDYLSKHIDCCNLQIEFLPRDSQKNVSFSVGDCRTVDLGKKAKTVICLYDVVGTYADNEENLKILRNIFRHLESGGTAILSVMNFEVTDSLAKYRFDVDNEYHKLLDLPPSNTMESTGNIFNPDYYMVDVKTHVVYRKEQFSRGTNIPTECIVRDRRFRYRYVRRRLRYRFLPNQRIRKPVDAETAGTLCDPGREHALRNARSTRATATQFPGRRTALDHAGSERTARRRPCEHFQPIPRRASERYGGFLS